MHCTNSFGLPFAIKKCYVDAPVQVPWLEGGPVGLVEEIRVEDDCSVLAMWHRHILCPCQEGIPFLLVVLVVIASEVPFQRRLAHDNMVIRGN